MKQSPKSNTESLQDTATVGTGGVTTTKPLAKLSPKIYLPISLLVAGIGTYMVFFSQAATSPPVTVSATVAGDLNNDTKVDTTDLIILLSMFGTTGGGTTPPPTTNPVPLGVPGNWKYKFGDEFEGTSLDLNKWQPNWLGPSNTAITKPVNDTEMSCYDPRQVSVGSGVLSLDLAQKSCTANNDITYGYSSGLINSYSHYQFTYGYIEARMWLDGTGGAPTNWPAFWANGTGNWPVTGEIDVMEGLGSGAKPICWHFHYSGGAPGGCVDLQPGNTGWHVFGADWQPGSITFYYDGVEVGKTTMGVTSSPMYLIANHGISSQYGGPAKAPSKIQVDYIRAWQR